METVPVGSSSCCNKQAGSFAGMGTAQLQTEPFMQHGVTAAAAAAAADFHLDAPAMMAMIQKVSPKVRIRAARCGCTST